MTLQTRAAGYPIAVLTMAVALHANAADNRWMTLRGRALIETFANQDLGDGVHFAYQFLAGGELRGMNMGKSAHGHWRIASNELCWRWEKSKDLEECYTVRRHGQAVRLFLDGQEVLSGDLIPLAPNQTAVSR